MLWLPVAEMLLLAHWCPWPARLCAPVRLVYELRQGALQVINLGPHVVHFGNDLVTHCLRSAQQQAMCEYSVIATDV